MSKPLVIYHGNCPDGFTAAWVAARALGDAELHAAKYGDEPPDVAGREVYVVDFSYPRVMIEVMHEQAHSLLVLDHHLTAEAALAGLEYCRFDLKRSGAGLAWDHFHPNEARPWIVEYVEDRDLWHFALPYSQEISLRVRLTPHELEAYDQLARQALGEVCIEGTGAKLYLEQYVRDALRNAYDVRGLFDDGETCRCVNVSYTGISDVLHGALEDGHRLALGWHLAEDGWLNCSLRSTPPLDCSQYAKALGGGGHAQASGFRVPLDSHVARRLLSRGAA